MTKRYTIYWQEAVTYNDTVEADSEEESLAYFEEGDRHNCREVNTELIGEVTCELEESSSTPDLPPSTASP